MCAALASVSLSLRVAVASAVTVDRDAVAEPEEEEEEEDEEEEERVRRRSVWEERCVVGQVLREVVVCVGDRTGMEENNLHRVDVAPAKRNTALRMETAGRCMECDGCFVPASCGCGWPNPNSGLWTRGGSACQKPIRLSSIDGYCSKLNPNLLVPLSS